jgi:hypothetical protein
MTGRRTMSGEGRSRNNRFSHKQGAPFGGVVLRKRGEPRAVGKAPWGVGGTAGELG